MELLMLKSCKVCFHLVMELFDISIKLAFEKIAKSDFLNNISLKDLK